MTIDVDRYKKVLVLLQKGDVILSFNKNNRLSETIARVTDSDYSHTMLYIGNGNVVESTVGGTKITPVKHYCQDVYQICIRRPNITKEQKEGVVKKSLTLLGKRYGYLQLAWYLFLRFIGQSENPKWQLDLQPNAMVCSEAIAYAFGELGIRINGRLDYSQIEPEDFAASRVFVTIFVG